MTNEGADMHFNIMSQAAIHKKMTVEGQTRYLQDWTNIPGKMFYSMYPENWQYMPGYSQLSKLKIIVSGQLAERLERIARNRSKQTASGFTRSIPLPSLGISMKIEFSVEKGDKNLLGQVVNPNHNFKDIINPLC